MHPLTITRTVYDPATRDFVFDSAESKALPNIRQWINNKNPVIYWYVLRVDNQSELQLDQWAIELYTHQALNIMDAYIDGIDHRFELKKREHDSWSDKYVLSIPKQLGIPIVGKGTRRVFFKVDINCREGLMHEYGISGRFISSGVEPVDIKEKFFQYSCKVGEFRQIFNNNPDEASVYAEKRLSTRYSDNDVHLFTNSFRMIHDLYRYCHSGSIQKEELMHKLHLLYANFERVPDIAKEKINPLLYDGIRELELIRNIDHFKSRYIRLCDSLVELLHIEVMGTNLGKGAIAAQENETPSRRTGYVIGDENISRQDGHTAGVGNKECPVCGNIIDPSNKSLLCKCGARFCQTCEGWFREPRKPGESLLCEKCFAAERDEKIRTERERALAKEAIRLKTSEEAENKRKEEAQRQWQAEQKLRKEEELKAQEAAHLKAAKEEAERAWYIKEDEQKKALEAASLKVTREAPSAPKKPAYTPAKRPSLPEKEQKSGFNGIIAVILLILLFGGLLLILPDNSDNSNNQDTVVPQSTEVIDSSLAAAEATANKTTVFEGPQDDDNTYTNSIGIEFVLIPAGEFQMGSPSSEEDRDDDEGLVHEVTIENAYYLGKYEVTQEQWVEIMGNNPLYFDGDNKPVEQISWKEVQEFVKKLNAKEGTDKYRLPSEAEWEYACRAGTASSYSFGDDESKLEDYAWYCYNSGNITHPVGQKKPNPWGLYDMHGNVWEWCQDRWHDTYENAPTDGSAWEDGNSSYRVSCGGSFFDTDSGSRSAVRFSYDPSRYSALLGFRLLREV